VNGPSFLGLSGEPRKDSAAYLLEDDEPAPNHKRMIVALLLLLVAAGVLAWHWRAAGTAWLASLGKTAPVVSVAPAATPSKTGGPALGSSAATGQAPSEPIAPVISSVTPRRTPPPLPEAGEANMVAPEAEAAKKSSPATSIAKPVAKPKPAHSAPAEVAQGGESSDTGDTPAELGRKKQNPAKRSDMQAANTLPAGSADDRLVADGQKYLYGEGVPENCGRAEKNFRTAAAHSNAHAMSLLGTMYATGHCLDLDLPNAYRWYARALHLDPSNDRIQQDLQVLWRQMNQQQRQAAIKAQ
jgi:hypothetical protein